MIRRLIILLLIVGCEETTAPEDACGVAGGDGTTCADCAGVSNGLSYLDECGGCDANVNNDCTQDECGNWGGDGVDADSDNICDDVGDCIVQDGVSQECGCNTGFASGKCDCAGNTLDCLDVCNGDAVEDECGVCDADSTNDCTADCNGDWGGDAILDACGVCGGEITILSECCESDVCISIQNIDLITNILEVWMMNNIPVAGFQFNISGVTIISASGGSAQSNGISPSISEHIVLGFSFSGNSIPPENSILTHIGFSEYNGSICLSDPVFSNNSGAVLSVELGECF